MDYSIKKAVELAEQKKTEAQRRASIINDYYNKGKNSYQARRYKEAMGYFEDILNMDPSYEPAKLYLESTVIQMNITEEQAEINNIKLKMADIIAEYERRREKMDSLAVKYFLEQAQQKCQLGNYAEAERLYNLCYKVNPYSKDKIEWFVKATYDMMRLSKNLEEHHSKIEELIVFEP